MDSGEAKKTAPPVNLEDAFAHIEKRRRVLGGVVLSGGEPLLFSGLGALISRIKSLGLLVKLATNGLLPGILENLFKEEKTRPDYIAMDLKTAPGRYRDLLPQDRADDPKEAITHSAALIRSSGIPHEFRSLALPNTPLVVLPSDKSGKATLPNTPNTSSSYFGKEDMAALAPLAGDSPWHIRPFVPGNCLDSAWNTAEL
jgi:pyruvate formate lyase activating enzyme